MNLDLERGAITAGCLSTSIAHHARKQKSGAPFAPLIKTWCRLEDLNF